ncbi:hypothetical protein OF83DRAFT_770656 [Amylostereum chailletii]|nr:hypothetical protein OF83DRAFT_770656 [Amylostereum chailletii]
MPLPASFSNGHQDRRWATYASVGITQARLPPPSPANTTPRVYFADPTPFQGALRSRDADMHRNTSKAMTKHRSPPTLRDKFTFKLGRSKSVPEPSPQVIPEPPSPSMSEQLFDFQTHMHETSMRYVQEHPPSLLIEPKDLPAVPATEAPLGRSRDDEGQFGRRRKTRRAPQPEVVPEEPQVPESPKGKGKAKDPNRTGPRYEKRPRTSSIFVEYGSDIGAGEREVPTQRAREEMEALLSRSGDTMVFDVNLEGKRDEEMGHEEGERTREMGPRAEEPDDMSTDGGESMDTWRRHGQGSGAAPQASFTLPLAGPSSGLASEGPSSALEEENAVGEASKHQNRNIHIQAPQYGDERGAADSSCEDPPFDSPSEPRQRPTLSSLGPSTISARTHLRPL